MQKRTWEDIDEFRIKIIRSWEVGNSGRNGDVGLSNFPKSTFAKSWLLRVEGDFMGNDVTNSKQLPREYNSSSDRVLVGEMSVRR